ncbi:MAG: hypothetical protein RHS_3454 [Robinsoniella sp. RHS]|nr:MAG: hypothetical protein RHS_3454 [Robinsoniella sp. RHS]
MHLYLLSGFIEFSDMLRFIIIYIFIIYHPENIFLLFALSAP